MKELKCIQPTTYDQNGPHNFNFKEFGSSDKPRVQKRTLNEF
jgi:hypothetical protein